MKKVLLIGFVTLFTLSVYGQSKEVKVIESKSATIEKTRGNNPNVVKERSNTDVAIPKPEKSRGDDCRVVVDNWTGYSVDIYVDGDYAGTVGAWSDGYTYTAEGQTSLYGKSVGGSIEWGPVYVDCYYEHTWKLTD
ncbi:MAG: hypothetical protein ISR55_07110 [Bacteroidetes bacterium]|nr:hypothetical protein [Bacteroidota bacterium]MBL6963573.1 hypothetical protein [Bacteroidota bacterium]